jgi:ABC-type tungstate transport system permease subunit
MRALILMACAVSLAPPLAGQNPQLRRQLQQQVVERFMENVRVQAGLSEAQMERVRYVARQSFEDRQALAERERDTWRALEGQMRPGVAADADSLGALMDQLLTIQEERVAQARQEQATYAEFLTPVQRAQLTIAWHRLHMQIERIRGGPGPARRPM